MNIFYLDECPKKAAELQYNKHVVKMILESAQMLCTAHHVHGDPNDNETRIIFTTLKPQGLTTAPKNKQ